MAKDSGLTKFLRLCAPNAPKTTANAPKKAAVRIIRLFIRFGFKRIANLRKCGYKLGKSQLLN